MRECKKKRRWWKWLLYAICVPIVLFLILAIMVYLPPIQRFAVNMAADGLSESVGINLKVEKIRLAFPLDLAVHGVVAVEEGDTLADIEVVRLDVRMWPLLQGKVDVDGLEIYNAKLNTKDWIPDVYIRGNVGKLTAATHGIDLKKELVRLDVAEVTDANLYLTMSDTAVVEEDTTAASKWNIFAEKVGLENTQLFLSLPGDSMRIGFRAGNVSLEKGQFDTGKGLYLVENLKLNRGGLAYLSRSGWNDGRMGNSAFHTADSLAWQGFVPQSTGIDPNYIDVNRWELELKDISFQDLGPAHATLSSFLLEERSGAKISNLKGEVSMAEGLLKLNDFSLQTPTSFIDWMGTLHMEAFEQGSTAFGQVKMKGSVSATDVKTLANGFLDGTLLEAWPASPLNFKVKVDGNASSVKMDTFEVNWPYIAEMKVAGEVFRPDSVDRRGEVLLDLQTHKLGFLQAMLSDEDAAAFSLPAGMSLKGKVGVNSSMYSVSVNGKTASGLLDLKGKMDLSTERYLADVIADNFPLHQFLPTSGLGALTANIHVDGRGFDPLSKRTQLDARVALDSLRMNNWQLGQFQAELGLKEGKGLLKFVSANDLLGGEGTLEADLSKRLDFKFRSDLPELNLKNILDLKHTLFLGSNFDFDVYTDRKFTTYGVSGKLSNLRFITDDKGIPAKDVTFDFDTSPDTISFATTSGDMKMNLRVGNGIEGLLADLEKLSKVIETQLDAKRLNQADLKAALPEVGFSIKAGNTNPMVNILREMGYTCSLANIDLQLSPATGVSGGMVVSAFSNGSLLLDTLDVSLRQDTSGLVANAWVKNFTKKNKTKFEGALKAYLLDAGAGAELMIKAQNGVKGMHFGVNANVVEDGLRFNLYPETPIIAFRNFTVNKDNYFFLGADSTVRADIDLLADDGTGLRIYSQPVDSVNDLTVSLNRLNLQELSRVLPYLPKLEGVLSTDFHVIDDHKTISAMATANAEKLSLEGAYLGNIGLEAIYLPQGENEHHANVFVNSEGDEVLALGGIYRSSGESEGFEGNAELLDFPLEILNGFLVGTDIAMSGKAGGNLSVDGDMSKPNINGELQFTDAHMFSDAYGFDFRMDAQPVSMVDNQLVVKDYALYSKQENNPLLLNGKLDMRDLSNVKMDFEMSAENFELINAKKQKKSLVFGKVYADFFATLKGDMRNMSVRGKLAILDRTDMTYILKDSPLTVEDRLHDLVQFVNFEDSVEVEETVVEPAGNFDMTMSIQISDAALFHCNLSEDGSNYVDLEGGGELTLRLTQQGDMRLTGRFTATSGEMEYSLPVIPLKKFKLVQGSYVEFTGDVANPTLNIAAKERMKAIVTENDQPRSVAFDVGVKITKPLNNMGLEFTIEAPEDLAVQNQLGAMTVAERGKTAVGMLATGMYLTEAGFDSSSSGFKASNALTSFLQSEIQNIAGSALKTIDLTIGMENNTSSTGATTTDYSFQFAKRFWGNRITVIVGGKVSTGAEAENSAESFIDNIAVEYRLDKTASRYVRVFYERSFQDPLEGQLTKTGAGLVLRRKSDRLGELFIFRNKDAKKKKTKKEKI